MDKETYEIINKYDKTVDKLIKEKANALRLINNALYIDKQGETLDYIDTLKQLCKLLIPQVDINTLGEIYMNEGEF